jgi:hypothetical protein
MRPIQELAGEGPLLRRPARGIALLLAAALALAAVGGCGGGGGSGGAAPASTGASTAQPPAASEGSAQGGAGARSGYEGGEKSIERFGSEAGGSERDAVLAAFGGYLEAVAARDYATACSHLAASVRQGMAQFAPPKLRRRGCAAILPQLLSPSASAIAGRQANGKVTRVRVEGERGFVVFHAPGAKLYQMPIVREGGAWKAGLLAASVLVPSAATLGR